MKKLFFATMLLASCMERTVNKFENAALNDINDSLIKTIVGGWGARDGSPVWKITKDSIFYFNENRSYYYLIHEGDFIGIYKEGPFMWSNIRVFMDTLYFIQQGSGGGETKAFRVKSSK